MTWAFLSVVALLLLVGWFAVQERGRRYEQIIKLLEAERDAARNEAKVFRNLSFPAIARAEGAAAEPPAHATPATTPGPRSAAPSRPAIAAVANTAPKTLDEVFASRLRYRDKFKMVMKLTNSKQQKTNALASALSQQKPVQEKPNVSA
jgi:hypothetical protein